MLQALIGPVSGLVGSWMEKKTAEQAGKSAVAKAKAEAEAKVMVSAATSTADWEKLMAKGSQQSLKDEWLCLPSVPLLPKPPGIRTPVTSFSKGLTLSGFKFSESIRLRFTFTLFDMPP